MRPPKAVLDATEAYLSAEDAIAAWIDERCERDPTAWASSANYTDRGQATLRKPES